MKNTFHIKMFCLSLSIALFLVGCTSNDGQSKEAATQPQQEQKKESPETLKGKVDNEVTIDKTFITKDEFNKMFKIDTEEEQFNNGKFQLKDNSIVKADYLSYGENDLFDYASAVFYNGKLASIQIETSKSQEELEKAFGIKFGDKIEPYKFGYEITFDKMFHESNISIYPNEWQ